MPTPTPSQSVPGKKPASAKPTSSAVPVPKPTGAAAPADEDPAAERLLEELERALPDLVVEGETSMDRLRAATEAVRRMRLDVERRLATWLATERAAAAKIAVAEMRLADARRAVADAEDALREQAGDFYMTPAWNEAFVFAAGNIEDAGRAQGYMAALLNEGVSVVEQLRTARTRLDRERAALRKAAAAVARAGQRIKRDRAVLEALDRKMRGLLDTVVRSYGTGSAEFSRIITAAQAGDASAPTLERFVFAPVAGRVSSPFGPRVHPIYRYRSLHTGLDLAAPAGTPVVAARDGTVLAAGPAGPFGLSVVIDHGGRIATVVSHLSVPLVSPGDDVRAGDVVGLVGCTGWCTGPHVHFEVWFEGVARDPALWMIEAPATLPLAPVRAPAPARLPVPSRPARPMLEAKEAETLAGLRNPFSDLSARP